MRQQFKNTMLALAEADPRVVLVLGDIGAFLMREFQERWPDRFYNMGICENALVSACAGMAAVGLVPIAHTINPFVTDRCYEQIKLDMVYNAFGGNIATIGASFDYAWDGPSHQTHAEMAMLRNLPNIEVLQPGSGPELDTLFRSQYANGRTTYYRMSDHEHGEKFPVEFGRAVVLQDLKADFTVMTAGPLLKHVLPVCRDLPVNLVYFHTLKPIDKDAILAFAHTRILVVHDAHGLREAINEVGGLRTYYHGLPDEFTASYGTVWDLRKHYRLDEAGIAQAIQKLL